MKIEKQVGSDCEKNLHYEFVKLGKRKRLLTNELLALLPEIYQSGIYRKYAKDIFKYAGRFGGLGRSVVEKRLRLEKYVKDKPELRDAIRTEGVHKVALVASLATAENDWALADKVKNMSKPALQELSKELRSKRLKGSGNLNLFEIEASTCKAIPTKMTIELDEEMSFMFLKLKKMMGKALSNKETMKVMMERLLEVKESKKIVEKDAGGGKSANKNIIKSVKDIGKSVRKVVGENAAEIVRVISSTDQKVIPGDGFGKKLSPYIKVSLRREKLAETGGKCSYPSCNKPSENFHHTEPFSEGGSHDSMKPLCKIHHEFMHNGLVENQQMEAVNWQLCLAGKLTYADHFYRHYRET